MTDKLAINSFFKAYDVRGEYPLLDENIFYWIGRGLVETILVPDSEPTEVAVLHDARLAGPSCAQALMNGIQDAGGTPRFFGTGSTDMLYAACQRFEIPGVMVTASHNPAKDIGAKIVKKIPQMLGLDQGLHLIRDYVLAHIKEEIPEIETLDVDPEVLEVKNYFFAAIKRVGNITAVNERLAKKPLKIVVDTGNGAAGYFMPEVQAFYPHIKWVEMYYEPDGTFPNHTANPTDYTTLVDLQQRVLAEKADFGAAYDGDADRLGFVNAKGEVVQGDFLMAEFIKAYSKRELSGDLQHAYVYIQPGSRCVPQTIAECDGVSIPAMQGHTYVKEKMAQFSAIYGGEYSGHHYFGEFAAMDSGVLALALMIDIMSTAGKTMHELFEPIGSYYFLSDLINFDLNPGVGFAKVKAAMLKRYDDAQFSEFDGLAVYYPDWKFSIRSSNTEPKVRFVLETRGADFRDEKIAEITEIFANL
jgi:phosphomannomutase